MMNTSSGSSTVTYMVRNENDEAMIVTKSKIANPGALTNALSSSYRSENTLFDGHRPIKGVNTLKTQPVPVITRPS